MSGPSFLYLLLIISFISSSVDGRNFKNFGTDTDPYANLTSVDDLINVLIRRDCMKVHCLGRGCEPVTEKNGCQLCLCPTGTPARGCDKMPPFMQGDLFWRGCPNDTDEATRTITRYPATQVSRWYRAYDKKSGIDECRSYPFPKCEDDLDFNLWSSPKTREECLDYCYNPESTTESPSTTTSDSTLSTSISTNGSNDSTAIPNGATNISGDSTSSSATSQQPTTAKDTETTEAPINLNL